MRNNLYKKIGIVSSAFFIFIVMGYLTYIGLSNIGDDELATTTSTTTSTKAEDKNVNVEGDANEIKSDGEQVKEQTAKYPFYSLLPYDSADFYIDIPTVDGVIPVTIKNKNNQVLVKTKVSEWFLSNGVSDINSLKIEWR